MIFVFWGLFHMTMVDIADATRHCGHQSITVRGVEYDG